ncbi:MAG: hypothetical protein CMI21_03325 [Opitutae bacterium]|nr:hypothetical protein [Opitutae bacterium]
MTLRSLIARTFFFSMVLSLPLGAQVKETHKIVEQWVQTKLLISEESTKWQSEKAALTDLKDALTREVEELDKSLETFQNEETTIEEERSKLTARKEEAEDSTRKLFEELEELRAEIDSIFKTLPAPLSEKLAPFREKLGEPGEEPDLPLRKRLEIAVSILQSVHLFNRSVTMERIEFTLEDDKSREFLVLYFGLGAAYFVNESGTIAGYGQPGTGGWNWTRDDSLASEVSAGVDLIKNRALPRFLELPLPSPERIER